MTVLFTLRAPTLNPLSLMAGALVLFGTFSLLRDRLPGEVAPAPCDPQGDVFCAADARDATARGQSMLGAASALPVSNADEACRNAGYLCADLSTADKLQIHRWKDFSGTIVVHIPRPEFEEPGVAIRLQQAAARGLRAWDGEPFPIYADLTGDRDPHFSVSWARSLSGGRIGVARTRWSPQHGLEVLSIQLATRSPFNQNRVIEPRQIRLTAGHEMGHALGLPHSDSERDVMYPTNTATSLTAQDYRTMEVLYSTPDGTQIVR